MDKGSTHNAQLCNIALVMRRTSAKAFLTIFDTVKYFFNILFFILLSVVTTNTATANDTFSLPENSYSRVSELNNAGDAVSKSNLLDVSWRNDIIGHRSANNALDFWKNTSKEFEHLVEDNFYLKFDRETGNLLFGNHKTKEIFGFYEGLNNIKIVDEKSLSGVLGKLKGYHGIGSSSYVNLNVSSGARIIANPNKTATIVGNYKRFPWHQGDMKELIPELLGDLKTQQFGAKKGGFNVLNVADEIVTDWSKFWDEFNKPWLDAAIKRGDDIWAASNPMDINLLFKKLDVIPVDRLKTPEDIAEFLKTLKDPKILQQITGFGNEIKLLSENGYTYNEISKMFVK